MINQIEFEFSYRDTMLYFWYSFVSGVFSSQKKQKKFNKRNLLIDFATHAVGVFLFHILTHWYIMYCIRSKGFASR